MPQSFSSVSRIGNASDYVACYFAKLARWSAGFCALAAWISALSPLTGKISQ